MVKLGTSVVIEDGKGINRAYVVSIRSLRQWFGAFF